MSDKGKILVGLLVFIAAVTFPFWRGFIAAGEPPEIELPAGETRCVEDAAWMKANHMNLLDDWRDQVVREEKKIYKSTVDGAEYEMSLTRTCMGCHKQRANFCDRCHTYADVKPYCWDCHVEPKGE